MTETRKTFEIDVDIYSGPAEVFMRFEDEYRQNFREMTWNDDPEILFNALSELASFSWKTQCYYPTNSAQSEKFFEKYSQYNYQSALLKKAGFI